jgi:hypothetical protein
VLEVKNSSMFVLMVRSIGFDQTTVACNPLRGLGLLAARVLKRAERFTVGAVELRPHKRVRMAEAAPSAISDAEQALNVASYSSNREMPVFAHLYASPLAQDTFNAQGLRELKPVDELQYGEERSALLEVLRLAGRAVKFKSEVGCSPEAQFEGQLV